MPLHGIDREDAIITCIIHLLSLFSLAVIGPFDFESLTLLSMLNLTVAISHTMHILTAICFLIKSPEKGRLDCLKCFHLNCHGPFRNWNWSGVNMGRYNSLKSPNKDLKQPKPNPPGCVFSRPFTSGWRSGGHLQIHVQSPLSKQTPVCPCNRCLRCYSRHCWACVFPDAACPILHQYYKDTPPPPLTILIIIRSFYCNLS